MGVLDAIAQPPARSPNSHVLRHTMAFELMMEGVLVPVPGASGSEGVVEATQRQEWVV